MESTPMDLAEGLGLLKDHSEAILLDDQGILRNVPDLAPLAEAPEDCQLWVDAGVRKGEDIIDVVMADVANPIVSVRHLTTPEQLDIAADYCESLMVAIDWMTDWMANPHWKALGWDGLADQMRRGGVDHLLLLCHDLVSLPHRPPTSWDGFSLYIALFDKQTNPWPEAKQVRPYSVMFKEGVA